METSRTAPPDYPFTAVVGQDRLRLALVLSAVSPAIGGVVVRGEKGTAKTTTVRALAPHLDGRLVDLPLGATEDRVVGSIDVEAVLTTGRARYVPGLLSAADGGILYVDEVNLLPDHLVDVLLDAAATGRIVVERDGVSHVEDTRFVLVGTMNPEEGELRPQLLDRFGLAVDVAASREPAVRAEILRRRLAYEDNPRAFHGRWADEEEALRARLTRARARLADIPLDDVALGRIAAVCAEFDVDGMRADLVIARTARAHAAWRLAGGDGGPAHITDDDIRVAAELALPHRRRRDPFDEPGLDEQRLDDAMDRARDEVPDDRPEEPEPPQEQQEPPAPEGAGVDDAPEPPRPGEPEPPEGPEESDDAPAGGTGGRAAEGAPFPRP
ncbi:ATP-binding protein [Corynebacterium sp. 335C]